MMDTDPDSFLNLTELDALNMSNTDREGRLGGGSGVTVPFPTAGAGAGLRPGQDDNSRQIPHPMRNFGFGSTSHHHHSHSHSHSHLAHTDAMDLSNFSSVFSDKQLDGGGGGGRRDDNVNASAGAGGGGQPGTSSSSSTSSSGNLNNNTTNNNVNFDALQQLLAMQMQMQSPTNATNLNPFSMSMSLPLSGSMVGLGDPSSPVQGHQGHAGGNTSGSQQAAAILEQQLRLQQLQQLQQLQNQIFQQQIELISGQTSLSNSLEATPIQTPFRDANSFQGLPTPANSTELRPQPPPNFVSPILQNYLAQPGTTQFSNAHAHSLPQGSSSAPAHLAFSTQAPLLSPGDLDFELSPITSPWLGAVSYQQAQQQLQQQHQQPPRSHSQTQGQGQGQSYAQSSQTQTQVQAQTEQTKRRASKRGASSSGDDADGLGTDVGHGIGHGRGMAARKRQSPAIRASFGGSASPAASSTSSRKTASIGGRRSGSISMSSTPALRAQQQQVHQQHQQHQHQSSSSRSNSGVLGIGEIVGDTPSPVDLSMPPPAPPLTESETSGSGSSVTVSESRSVQQPVDSTMSTNTSSGSSGPSPASALSPVTPASIMNLGRLGLSSGLSSPVSAPEDQQKTKGKGKTKSLPKATSSSSTTSTTTSTKSISKKPSTPSTPTFSVSQSLISPSLKPLLPGGLGPSSAAQLGSASNYTHHLSGTATALQIAPSTSLPPPTPTIRKTSHKAAEQKRRDSLKTSFDQLRLLLPPLPLPNEEGYQLKDKDGDGPLPGSMPPRGPPRGDVQGPNRAVSKLTLLRCGNEYIRVLKGRVERRDGYIEELKREVRALRSRVGGTGTDQVREREDERMVTSEGEGEGEGVGVGEVEDATKRSTKEVVDGMAEEIGRVDLERDIDAEEENLPILGFGLGRDEGDEDD